jgi:membrane protease YdiL (CAAX protease family)
MLDLLLAICLIGLLPAHAQWRSLAGRRGAPRPRGYVRTLAVAGSLLVVLAASWAAHRRSLAALGLAAPQTPAALAGLGVAVVILTGFAIAVALQMRSPSPGAVEALSSMPATRTEAMLFAVKMPVTCLAAELLYRGFLLWYLSPRLGVVGAVAVASAAYALAHAFTNVRAAISSALAATAFTVGYAVTQSLWWLMILHVGFPALGAFGRWLQLRRPLSPRLSLQP